MRLIVWFKTQNTERFGIEVREFQDSGKELSELSRLYGERLLGYAIESRGNFEREVLERFPDGILPYLHNHEISDP